MVDRPLRMLRLELDGRRMVTFASRGLPPGHEDHSFLAHRLLAALFGEGVVQPFRLLEERGERAITLLGYTRIPADELIRRADETADPGAHSAVIWSSLAEKQMPVRWQRGSRYGFEVRVCPVVRLARERSVEWRGEQRLLAAGAEVDAFVHARYLGGRAADRATVYNDWLGRRFAEAAVMVEASIGAFRRLRLVRRTHEPTRRSRVMERPDALVKGVLEVGEPERFQELLARGVGRHRSYGFGMLLLKPVT